jgi:hypothetical protein
MDADEFVRRLRAPRGEGRGERGEGGEGGDGGDGGEGGEGGEGGDADDAKVGVDVAVQLLRARLEDPYSY